MKKISRPNRRDFLKQSIAASAVGATPVLTSLSAIAEAAAPGNAEPTEVADDYKAIVCVFLYGGQDHANILIPYQDNASSGTTEYDRYAAARSGSSPQNESGPNLSFSRATLGANSGAQVITSTATSGLPTGITTDVYGRRFAIHPSYREIAYLYKQANSKLAFIANVGPLTAPVNRDQVYHLFFSPPNDQLPVNLYSHDDQIKSWMSGRPHESNPILGAGGGMAAQLAPLNGAAQIPISISVAGVNTFLLSDSPAASAYQIGAGSVGRIETSGSPPTTFCNTSGGASPSATYCLADGPAVLYSQYTRDTALMNVIRQRYTPSPLSANIYEAQWRETMDLSLRTGNAISQALSTNPLNEDTVKSFSEYRPSSNQAAAPIDIVGNESRSLAAQLRMVSALIRASAALGASATQPIKRQVFFVGIGGFDTHGNEFWGTNSGLNGSIDQAVDAFWQSLGKIKVRNANGSGTQVGVTGQDRVTLFTMSDFGRTLDSNGQGSDHGWGGIHFALGGAVKGGKIYGANHNVAAADIPTDTFDNPQTVGQKSRAMSVDSSAGAMPRYGIPPNWYDGGTRGPGGKCNGLNHSLDRGELLPTLSSDAYVATIARWFGVPASGLATIFPKLADAHPAGGKVPFDSNQGVGFITIT